MAMKEETSSKLRLLTALRESKTSFEEKVPKNKIFFMVCQAIKHIEKLEEVCSSAGESTTVRTPEKKNKESKKSGSPNVSAVATPSTAESSGNELEVKSKKLKKRKREAAADAEVGAVADAPSKKKRKKNKA
jgi:hypothetical protein